MIRHDLPSIEEVARESDAIEAAIRAAVRQTLIEHKRAGDPVVFCGGGVVRWVPANEIVIPDEPGNSASSATPPSA